MDTVGRDVEAAGSGLPAPREVRALLAAAEHLFAAARTLLADDARARAEVHQALSAVRARSARAELAEIPVARLKDVTGGRLRLGALQEGGYTTVLRVLDATPYALQLLPGIGARTAGQVHAAARQIAQAAEETVSVRVDAERQDPETTALLIALYRLVAAGPDLPRACAAARHLAGELAALLPAAQPARGRLRMLLAGHKGRHRARTAIAGLAGTLTAASASGTRLLLNQASVDLLRPPASGIEAWVDFELRAAEYYNLLAELAALEPDHVAAEGFLPEEVSTRVRAQELDDTHRRVSLRGYQSFGARFALAQKRVILGDEMGLGKTVQAVAVLAHLKARGATHFLVACPASVLINWTREIENRSTLKAYPLHGPERAAALAAWLREGDVAVTTIDSLHRLETGGEVPLGMLVVDEAHYVKNPEARRSKAVATWCGRTDRVLFMSGTPMENRVEEFRSLLGYLRPDLAAGVRGSDAAAGAQAFRRAVAPVYLRRNQEDVLTELPDLVHVDEWEAFSPADLTAYREAVTRGNFMAMRRAAYAVPKTSAKLERLVELVDEAASTGVKVVVFSYFRDVVTAVHDALADVRADGHGPGGHRRVHGPITGGLSVEKRQQVVDEFTAAPGHAVLLGQIQAGGVGLNLQAASVVILCEPQVKPTMESQAVGRAHRMGQTRKVQVHRMLTPDSVDQRMLDILGEKTLLFDAYARRSDLAESTPDAIDVSEQALARQIVEEEQRRLAVGPAAGVTAPGR
ncbi:DEAD/DEAH box helicase [Sphaerisporangium sp. TRM90804]|uniref:DEAD/DEAH box helicase n=1 Tax=Sphaerisporangium sp. TRM90804 TaxID=3031113 RepID=UPI00244BC5C7|nr:DEAD/DEAH box helicase [Sphaerisporangium sp. TRM90804]MDH2425840.1 DEAD/DEAH box helicase [Sphaerisporangium sp. TRM90804]